MIYGAMGIVWAVAFFIWFRNSPGEHPRCNDAERALTRYPTPNGQTAASDQNRFPWQAFLRSYNVWLLCVINCCINFGWIFLVTWMPTFLGDRFNLNGVVAGRYSGLAGLLGMLGCVSGGWITDRLIRRCGLTWGRRWPAIIACVGPALAYCGCIFSQELWLTLSLFGCVWFLSDLWNAAAWSTYQDIGGGHVASLLALGNMCGNLGAAIFSQQIGSFVKGGDWTGVFVISAVSFLIAFVCWLFVNPRRPIVAP